MARPDPLRELAITLGLAVPGFLACSAVYLAIEPIATNRWRPFVAEPAQSLALVTIIAYLSAGLVVAGFAADSDVTWGGCGVVTAFSLGILVPIWVGLGRTGISEQPLFALALWLQPLLAVGAYLLGAGLVVLLRRGQS